MKFIANNVRPLFVFCAMLMGVAFIASCAKDAVPCFKAEQVKPHKTDVAFTNCSEEAIEVEWDFGDGTTSKEENPVHRYAESGVYSVKLTAFNEKEEAFEITQNVTVAVPVTYASITSRVKGLQVKKDDTVSVSFYGILRESITKVVVEATGSTGKVELLSKDITDNSKILELTEVVTLPLLTDTLYKVSVTFTDKGGGEEASDSFVIKPSDALETLASDEYYIERSDQSLDSEYGFDISEKKRVTIDNEEDGDFMDFTNLAVAEFSGTLVPGFDNTSRFAVVDQGLIQNGELSYQRALAHTKKGGHGEQVHVENGTFFSVTGAGPNWVVIEVTEIYNDKNDLQKSKLKFKMHQNPF